MQICGKCVYYRHVLYHMTTISAVAIDEVQRVA